MTNPSGFSKDFLDEKIFSTCSTEECLDDCQCEKMSYNDLLAMLISIGGLDEDLLGQTQKDLSQS